MHFTLFPSLTTPDGGHAEISWEGFLSFVASPVVAADKSSLEGWSPARFRDNHRDGDNVEVLSAIVLDDDKSGLPLERIVEIWHGVAGVVHTTHSHMIDPPDHPKYRLVLRTNRDLTADEHARVRRFVGDHARAQGQALDDATRDAPRFWYAPGHRAGAPYAWHELEGAPLDVDAILAQVPADVPGAARVVAPFVAVSTPRATRRAEAAGMLGRAMPAVGSRHAAKRALAGALWHSGTTEADAISFMREVYTHVESKDGGKIEGAVRDTYQRAANGKPIEGWHTLGTRLDPIVVKIARELLSAGALEEADARFRLEDPPAAPRSDERPAFPVSALPAALRHLATAQAEFTQVPTDLPAMLSIGACSASIAGKLDLEVQPRYVEPLNLFVLIGLATGERKSPNFDVYFSPIQEAERRLVEAAKPLIAQQKAKREALERLLKKRQSDYAATKPEDMALSRANNALRPGGAALDHEVQELATRLDLMEIPATPRLLVDDCTVERLASIMAEQRGRLCVASDEASIMSIVAGRYAKDGKASFEVLLKGYSGTEIRIDRQSKDRPPVYVRRPRLTVCLAVQPSVISGMSRDPTMRGQGLLARFLYSLPASKVGGRKVDVDTIDPQIIRAYNDTIARLQAIPIPAEGEPIPTIKLSSGALDLHLDFRRRLEPRLHPITGDLADIVDWANKLPGNIARIAGVFHVVDNGPMGDVSAHTMSNALQVGEYLLAHALAAYGAMGVSAVDRDAAELMAWAKAKGLERFTLRDVRRAGPRPIRDDRQRILDALQEATEQGRLQSDGKAWVVCGVANRATVALSPVALEVAL
jgi:replicative DNA helicase